MKRQLVFSLLLILAAGCNDDGGTDPYIPPRDFPTAGLWVAAGSDPALLHLAPNQLLYSGSTTPAATITTSSATLFTINGVAFDSAGAMWVASADDSKLIAFSANTLAVSGNVAANIVLSPVNESLSAPAAIAFDRQQRLWVANAATGTLVRYDPGQRAASGAPEPATIIVSPQGPSAIAFDASGGMWVANPRSGFIARYSPAQLEQSGALTPSIAVRVIGAAYLNPIALAFDAAGNLWVAYAGGGTIAAFTPAQLADSETLAPHITLTSTPGSFGLPVGLAFDANGALWVVSAEGSLVRFAASRLRSSGAPNPSGKLLMSGYTLLSGLAFSPKPGGLPLN